MKKVTRKPYVDERKTLILACADAVRRIDHTSAAPLALTAQSLLDLAADYAPRAILEATAAGKSDSKFRRSKAGRNLEPAVLADQIASWSVKAWHSNPSDMYRCQCFAALDVLPQRVLWVLAPMLLSIGGNIWEGRAELEAGQPCRRLAEIDRLTRRQGETTEAVAAHRRMCREANEQIRSFLYPDRKPAAGQEDALTLQRRLVQETIALQAAGLYPPDPLARRGSPSPAGPDAATAPDSRDAFINQAVSDALAAITARVKDIAAELAPQNPPPPIMAKAG